MGVAGFFLSPISSTDVTSVHPDSTTSDCKPIPNNPVNPYNGATSTVVDADDDVAKPKTTPYNSGAATHRTFHTKYDQKDELMAIDLITSDSPSEPGIGIYRQDPKGDKGTNANLSPDVITLVLSLFNSFKTKITDIEAGGPKNSIGWPQLLQWIGFKLSKTTLDNGRYATRVLTTDKMDPMGKVFNSKGSLPPRDPEGEEAESECLRTPPDGKDPENKEDRRLKCARYAMRVLSNTGFKTHSIGALSSGTLLQMQYYDRSSIVISQEIDMAKDPESFIAMLIGLHRLSLEKHGILQHQLKTSSLVTIQNTHRDIGTTSATLFEGRKLTLKKEDGTPVPGIIGRDTCFVEATAEDRKEWKDMETVVKISWQAQSRPSEKDFMNDVKNAVDKDVASHQLGRRPPSQYSPVPRLRDGRRFPTGEARGYEKRVCRIMVQEKLCPITSLREPRHYAQGIFEVLQRWVYDHARIIHRDISMTNLMWRKRNGVICGVLNDFDLSSYRDRKILVLLCCRYEIQETPAPEGKDQLVHVAAPPFEKWYNMSYSELYKEKYTFFISPPQELQQDTHTEDCSLKPHTERENGLLSQLLSSRPPGQAPVVPKKFDDATLGGFVDYAGFFTAMHNFVGQDLIAKYDPNAEPA
ncbi:hypothetical protein F5146DRAFT_1118981 [Armillaria mellea]|nr:hypothetical protein F5146DRAFT_1118981 [Armillaria mellea]